MSNPKNLLFIMSDQHNRKVAGCYGNVLARTPNIDRLAAGGTLFSAAYSPSPICVPARAVLATGRQVHETRNWDNASPYTGEIRSWGHRLRAHGIRVESIGKLHYRNATDDTGFDKQIIPMHVVDEAGDVLGSVKDPLPLRRKAKDIVNKIGIGESTYTNYDRDIAARACNWIKAAASEDKNSPWMLFVSFVAPHPPWFAPQPFFDLYAGVDLPTPQPLDASQDHPWLEARRASFVIDPYFTPDLRRRAVHCYYALTSFMDHNVGLVLDALRASGFAHDTQVIYTSDHGENLGGRALWGKGTLNEDSGGIPMIVAGPDVPSGQVRDTPVSLQDIYPSVLDTFGIAPDAEDAQLSGRSVFRAASEPSDASRVLLTQYHAAGATSGAFMLRRGDFKYLHYVGFRPQLYNLACDPAELDDLALKPDSASQLREFERLLRGMVDPERIDAMAKSDQHALVEEAGGREAVERRGTFGSTPAPGEKPVYE